MIKRFRKKGLTAPGCNWLGPFNPLDAPPPTCHSDQLAKEHDFDYHFASSAGEVRKADRRAIAGFAGDFIINKSPYALLGLAGIGTKYCVESVTGVIYPTGFNKFTSRKQQSCCDIQQYHKALDCIQEAEEENLRNHNKQGPLEVRPELEEVRPGSSRGRSGALLASPVIQVPSLKLEQSAIASNKGTYSPYNTPQGYKVKETWSEGPNTPEGWSWFQEPRRKDLKGITGSGKLTKVSAQQVTEKSVIGPKKIVPASCGRDDCITASESETSTSTQEDGWWKPITIKDCERALLDNPGFTPPPSRCSTPQLERLRKEVTSVERFIPSFVAQRVCPVELAAGPNMDGPNRASVAWREANETYAEWGLWSQDTNNVAKSRVQSASRFVEKLFNSAKSLNTAVREQAEELRFIKDKVGAKLDMQHQAIVAMEERMAHGSREGLSRGEDDDIILQGLPQGLAMLEGIIRNEITSLRSELVERIDRLGGKVANISGEFDRLRREDFTVLGRKMDVTNRRVKEVTVDRVETDLVHLKPLHLPPQVQVSDNMDTSEGVDTDEGAFQSVLRKRKRNRKVREDVPRQASLLTTPGEKRNGADTLPPLKMPTIPQPAPRVPKQKQLYAEALASKMKVRPSNKPEPIVVTRDHESGAPLSPGSIMKAVTQEIDVVSLGVGVDACRRGKDKLLLVPRNQEEGAVLSSALQGKGFKVRDPVRPWRPLLVSINRVDRSIPQDQLRRAVWRQNDFLKDLLTPAEMEEGFIPSFRKGRRDLDDVIWVVRVSAKVRDILLGARNLNIGFARANVKDFIDLNRCFKCQAYGHTAARCTETEEVCGRCAGTHRTDGCKVQAVRCANCQRAGLDASHAVTDGSCPAYEWAMKKLVNMIDVKGGVGPSKSPSEGREEKKNKNNEPVNSRNFQETGSHLITS